MRALLSRGLRPRLSLADRLSALPPLPKREPIPKTCLTLVDAFTILLGPVLTTAFAVDAGLKIKRIADIETQIATVQQQTELLQQRQIEAWTRLQQTSVSNGIRLYGRIQRRWMSTAAEIMRPDFEEMENWTEQGLASDEAEEVQLHKAAEQSANYILEEQRSAVQRYDRLVATRLAMQLMLQLKTGRSTKHAGFVDETIQKPMEVNVNLNILIREQDRLTKEMRAAGISDLPWDIPQPQTYLDKKRQLTTEVDRLSKRYRRGEVDLLSYVLGYADLVAEYKMGPSNAGYVVMMRAFHLTNWRVLSTFAESAIWSGKTTLSDYDIAAILFRHASDMDALRLHNLKQSLPKDSRWPKAMNPWVEVRANDLRVSIPSSRNPFLIAGLIRASLFCNQLGDAEAYGAIFIQINEFNQWNPYPNLKYIVSSAFLQYYSLVSSWSRGLPWLSRACEWTQQLIEQLPDLVGRLAMRILDFCLACERTEEYEFVLNTVIDCNLMPAELDRSRPINVTPRMMAIRQDWAERAKLKGNPTFGDQFVPFKTFEGQKLVVTLSEYFASPARQYVRSEHDNYISFDGPRYVAQLHEGSRITSYRQVTGPSIEQHVAIRQHPEQRTISYEHSPRTPAKPVFEKEKGRMMDRTEESPLFPKDIPWQAFNPSSQDNGTSSVNWGRIGLPITQGPTPVDEGEPESEKRHAAAAG